MAFFLASSADNSVTSSISCLTSCPASFASSLPLVPAALPLHQVIQPAALPLVFPAWLLHIAVQSHKQQATAASCQHCPVVSDPKRCHSTRAVCDTFNLLAGESTLSWAARNNYGQCLGVWGRPVQWWGESVLRTPRAFQVCGCWRCYLARDAPARRRQR
jgi:hypothetical protein